MKDILMHIAIVIFGCGWIIYTVYICDDIKMFTAITFTFAWIVVLIIHIFKYRKEKSERNSKK